jgi:ribosomal-protein-alanine N-acetyltransferase
LKVNWRVGPVLADDASVLSDIDRRASAYPWTEQQFVQACGGTEGTERALLIANPTLCAGFVVYNRVLDEGSIHNLAVLPELQRQGLARKLLEAAFEAMAGQGAVRALLDVRASNGAARGLYRALGFEVDGVRAQYYRAATGREDAILMSRLL